MRDNNTLTCIFHGLPPLSLLGGVEHTIRIIIKAGCNFRRAFVNDNFWRNLKKKYKERKPLEIIKTTN